MSDPTGYTLDFDLYWEKHRTRPLSPYGLTHNAVMELVKPFHFQGYEVLLDNVYTSPTFVNKLLSLGMRSTGTLTTTRKDAPSEVAQMKMAMKRKNHGNWFVQMVWSALAHQGLMPLNIADTASALGLRFDSTNETGVLNEPEESIMIPILPSPESPSIRIICETACDRRCTARTIAGFR